MSEAAPSPPSFFWLFLSGSGLMISSVAELSGGQHVRGISVAQAPEFPQATLFVFRDGHVEADLVAEYVTNSADSTVHDFAAPLVPEGWTREQPVPAWAVSTVSPQADWRQPLRGALGSPAPAALEAVRSAEEKQHLQSAPHAPALRWLADPDADIERQRRMAWLLALGAHGIWLGLASVGRLARNRPA
jgi:hypothetical protein